MFIWKDRDIALGGKRSKYTFFCKGPQFRIVVIPSSVLPWLNNFLKRKKGCARGVHSKEIRGSIQRFLSKRCVGNGPSSLEHRKLPLIFVLQTETSCFNYFLSTKTWTRDAHRLKCCRCVLLAQDRKLFFPNIFPTTKMFSIILPSCQMNHKIWPDSFPIPLMICIFDAMI